MRTILLFSHLMMLPVFSCAAKAPPPTQSLAARENSSSPTGQSEASRSQSSASSERGSLQPSNPTAAKLDVTYLANQGVMIEAGGARVMIDGLHRFYKESYPVLPPETARRVEQAEAPYDDIDVILVSHFHRDHFHPEAVASYLRHAPKSVLASSAQVTDAVRAAADSPAVAQRIRTVPWSPSVRQVERFGNIEVTFLGMSHGQRPGPVIENFGHLVRMAGRSVIHLGDAEPEASTFEPHAASKLDVDVGFIPHWFWSSDSVYKLLTTHVRAKNWVAFHVQTDDPAGAAHKVHARDPSVVVFTDMLKSYEW